jgi:hypothetical protein
MGEGVMSLKFEKAVDLSYPLRPGREARRLEIETIEAPSSSSLARRSFWTCGGTPRGRAFPWKRYSTPLTRLVALARAALPFV